MSKALGSHGFMVDRITRGVGLLVVAAGLTACTGSTPSTNRPNQSATAAASTNSIVNTALSATPTTSDTGTARQACSLLTADDMQQAFGAKSDSGTLSTAPGTTETICTWTLTESSGSGFGVELDVYPASTKADFTQQRQSASSPTHDVAGLGDAAYSERADLGANQIFDDLWVHAGTTSFRVEVLKDLGPDPLVPLAKKVISKLP